MATAKTGSFYLTETVTLAAAAAPNSRVQGTIDLGAYVNVPTGQAIAIDQVDFIYQGGSDFGSPAFEFVTGNAAITTQLVDLNPNTQFVVASDASLIASGSLNIDFANNVTSHMSDLYPDNFGPTSLSESYMVVNDTLYLTAGNDGAAISVGDVKISARIRCRVVKLSTKDWMAIAIQSTASDN